MVYIGRDEKTMEAAEFPGIHKGGWPQLLGGAGVVRKKKKKKKKKGEGLKLIAESVAGSEEWEKDCNQTGGKTWR